MLEGRTIFFADSSSFLRQQHPRFVDALPSGAVGEGERVELEVSLLAPRGLRAPLVEKEEEEEDRAMKVDEEEEPKVSLYPSSPTRILF